MLVPPLGGAERKVTDVEVYPSVAYSIGVNPPRVAWSADAKSLVVVDRSDAGEPFSLFLVAVDTGEKRRLTFPKDLSSMDSGPAVSPDGHSLVFTRSSGNLGVGDLYLLSSFDGPHPGPLSRLTFDNQQNGHPAWTPDGHEIVFTSARGRGSLNLWRLNPSDSKGPKRLAGVGEDGIFPALSRERRRLAYTKYSLDSNIWRIEMGSPTAETSLISSTRQDVMPRLSPDGGKVAFSSDRSGNFQIWRCNQDGSNTVQLTFFAGVSFAPAWSPDGKRIVFSSNNDGTFKIYIVDTNGGTPRAVANSAGGGWPFFSRDGKWIYFNSDRSGRDEVWKVPSAGGPAVQLTHAGGYMPQESPDGQFLYFMKSFTSGPLYRAALTGGAETVVLESIAARGYAITDKGIYFAAVAAKTDDREYYEVRSNKNAILFFDFTTGRQTVVAAAQPPLQLGITASAGARSVLFSRLDRMDEDLMLVDNFH